ncbi:major facilitator superfamily domain-containing protein [Gorgonomyces haynaldii]|nr:major facilitator superfamily domain-containing protein [Gorgonomyces haynaldii]
MLATLTFLSLAGYLYSSGLHQFALASAILGLIFHGIGRKNQSTIQIIVFALIIDILAFTIILPLLPRLLNHYNVHDKSEFYLWCKQHIIEFRNLLGGGDRLDIVLFGGFVGSLFSFLQFVISPLIGAFSDSFGRKFVLVTSMFGNALSMGLWIFADSFFVFLLSRIVGGLTEGNVQMSIAMITDITPEESRSKNLAWVGISFALGFTVGPPLGAYLAKMDLKQVFPDLPVNSFSTPALFAFVLICIETVYLILYLPETKGFKKVDNKKKSDYSNPNSLAFLGWIHFLFLFVFSGMEFTLTFLTFDRFKFTNVSQGMLLGYLGILSALVQGGYVRRVAHKKMSEASLVFQGILSCSIGLAILGHFAFDLTWLYIGATFLAFTSGTVVTSLTSLASLSRDEHDESQGKILGTFRSMGQLGRSLGPIASCTGYYILGSRTIYLTSGALLFVLALACKQLLVPVKVKKA